MGLSPLNGVVRSVNLAEPNPALLVIMSELTNLFAPPILLTNPRRNFSNTRTGKRTESTFALSFVRAFVSSLPHRPILVARELSMNGYGIADFVCVIRTPRVKQGLFAFEIKMSDWRKALSQAYRYRYFANKAVVILPFSDAERAKLYCSTFKALGIGLWAFDKNSGQIKKIYTPRYRRPLNPAAKEKALNMLQVKTKFLPVS